MKYDAKEVVLYLHEKRLALVAVLHLTLIWIWSNMLDVFKSSMTSPRTNSPWDETVAVYFCTEAEYQSPAAKSINKENKIFLVVTRITLWEQTKRRGKPWQLKPNDTREELKNLRIKVMNAGWPKRFANFN